MAGCTGKPSGFTDKFSRFTENLWAAPRRGREMIRRVMGTTMVLAAVLMAGESVYAAPMTALRIPVHAKMFSRDKQMVSFHLRNDSKDPLTVKAGAQEMTLEPGKPVDVTLKIGDTVTVAKATAALPEGTVLATVNSDLKGTTIALR